MKYFVYSPKRYSSTLEGRLVMPLASVYETSHLLFPSPPSIFAGSLSHEHQSSIPQSENPSIQQLTASPFSRKKEMNPELPTSSSPSSSRYENQKRRDWATFGHYLKNHKPPLALNRCSGAHVLEFLRYLDQFGKTKVHHQLCAFYGCPNPPVPCPCPLRQAWGSLDALVGRLRAAFDENGGRPELNPFGARAVRLYLREVKDLQSKARGVSYEKKKRKKPAGKSAGTALPPPLYPSSRML